MAYLANKNRDVVVQFLNRRIEKYAKVAEANRDAVVSKEMLKNAKASLAYIKTHPEIEVWSVTSMCAIV